MPLSVSHIIAECPDYNEERQKYFGNRVVALEYVLGEVPQRGTDIADLIKFFKRYQHIRVDINQACIIGMYI